MHKISQKYFDSLYDMVVDEEFDTDAVEMDVNNNNKLKQSNIINFIKKVADQNVNINESDLSGLLSVGNACIENVLMYGDINSQYSPGIRYWYWPYYKNITDEYNIVYKTKRGQPAIEFNAGYVINDWYIESVYDTFKDEMMNNQTASFSME
eukprot:125700_1